jgi:hypothetical protein
VTPVGGFSSLFPYSLNHRRKRLEDALVAAITLVFLLKSGQRAGFEAVAVAAPAISGLLSW